MNRASEIAQDIRDTGDAIGPALASLGALRELVGYLEGKVGILVSALATQRIEIDVLKGLAGIGPVITEMPPEAPPSPPAPRVGALR